ncbi:hypothetical protein L596_011042 [Steinernema carpocapsae]|uniref:Uncharacterized protein n=1 Tax=Steinernema carpocapsae TaxID=34508 RepID=A0A4U5NTF8_STECR|nr:hypothetical protein L596_011042 [Steinernema carpocapsae]
MLSCQLCCCCTQSPPTTPSAVTNHSQFFESINPLDGFEDSNALEEYLFAQSKKIEPGKDDARTMEILKPKRPMKTLVSPGIKVPKNLKNHQAPPLSPNVYHRSAPRSFSKPLTTEDRSHPNTLSSATLNSPNEGSTFAIVDINPGNKPKFIGDAKPGTILEGRQLPTLRKSIPPPSPSLKSELPQEMAPPPLFPRRVSSPMTEDSPPRTASSECSFVFPPPTASSPTDSAWASSSEGGASPPSVPPVPPRRIVRGPYVSLPAPLPVDSVSKHFWRGELSPTSPTVSLSVPLHTDSVPRPPELPPRQRFSNEMEPPPRPPKKIPGKPLSLAILDGPAPPPLPPKTYKQRLQHK